MNPQESKEITSLSTPTTSGAHGIIDEFAIYREVLSQKDIQRDMEFLVSDVKPEGKLAVTWGG